MKWAYLLVLACAIASVIFFHWDISIENAKRKFLKTKPLPYTPMYIAIMVVVASLWGTIYNWIH